jgi:hypothetical protein
VRDYKERIYQYKTNNNMRTKLKNLLKPALLIGAVMCCFSSCEKPNTPTTITNYQVGLYSNGIKIVEIDSCEYLWGDWGNATVLTHKGNCKYCAKRSLK